MQIGPVRGDKRPERAGQPARPVRGPRRSRFGKGLCMQGGKTRLDPEFHQTVTVNRIGVGGCHSRACREVGGVNLMDKAGVVDHHLCAPKRRRRIAGAGDQLLPHAAVQK